MASNVIPFRARTVINPDLIEADEKIAELLARRRVIDGCIAWWEREKAQISRGAL